LETTTPTKTELDLCPHIHLTCETEWNPQTVRLTAANSAEAEGSCDVKPGLAQISPVYSFREIAEAINEQRFIKSTQVDVTVLQRLVSSNQHSQINSENLSERWNIGLNQAKTNTSSNKSGVYGQQYCH
jgi:hypothetical protein